MEKLKKLKEVDWKHLKWKDIKDIYTEFKEIIKLFIFWSTCYWCEFYIIFYICKSISYR